MKKMTWLVALMLALAMVFCLGACSDQGNDAEQQQDADDGQELDNQEQDQGEPEGDGNEAENPDMTQEPEGGNGGATGTDSENQTGGREDLGSGTGLYSSMEEYVAAAGVEDMDMGGLDVEIYGQDNQLVYEYTVDLIEGSTREDMAASLEENLMGMSDYFTSLAGMVGQMVTVENPVIVIRYLDPDGELIYGCQFDADGMVE